MFSLVLLQRLLIKQQSEAQSATAAQALFVKNKIESELKSRIEPLQLLGARWHMPSDPHTAEDMESDAALAMSGDAAFQATEWVDPTLHVRWVAPRKGNEGDIGTDLGANAGLRDVFQSAVASGNAMASHPLQLRRGGQGVLVCVPVDAADKSSGFLVGVFRYQQLLNSILGDVAQDYFVAIYDGSQNIYQREGSTPPRKEAPAQEENIQFQQLTWRAQVWPAPEKAAYPKSILPQITFVGGIVLATWIAFAAFAAETERFRAKEVAASNTELKREIAGREQAEEALREAQKLEAVGRLAGGVAHDFNNLLMVIRGHATLLLNRLGLENPRRREVNEIVKATDQASSLTRQLLALGRKQVLKPRVLSLNALVLQVSELLPPVLGEDIEVVMELNPELGRVKADSSQIEQIIMNLVFNARDAMPAGGQLTIRTENVDLDESWAASHPEVTPGQHVLLTVRDTGCGMDQQTQSHIFEPFFTTKDRTVGSGLGLAIVYGTVRQSGGCITVSSKVGEGTGVQIYLQRVEEAIESDEVAGALPQPVRGAETVLVVEDDDAVRRMTREFLLISGYTVVEARSAADAMSLIESDRQPIDLVLTDMMMPGMKGSELGEWLSKLDSQIRVLYMSAYTEDAAINFGFLASGTAFIEKPFSPDELARKVRDLLAAKKDDPRTKYASGV